MRVKLSYPKIGGSKDAPFEQCVAFEKYDGTNMHWVWEKELGWYAFGTRRNRFDFDSMGVQKFAAEHRELKDAPRIFLDQLADPLISVFSSKDFYDSTEISVFAEFVGPNSFAGRHVENDEKKLVLFDVETSSGFLGPKQFIGDFKSLEIARVVYEGRLTGRFINDVREGKYNVTEGVVCKGGCGGQDLWMAKVKTNQYMEKLKNSFSHDWESFWE